jgi:3-oxoacyl-[acyl-carrier protein] reductase
MIGFTRSLSRELGPANITVNAVAPGYMDTEMSAGLSESELGKIARRSALNRLTTVDEVAAAIGFLISDAASAITGTVTTVDAGATA